MQVKYWTNFNKRKNSTKQPSGGTEVSVSLKNPCSVENPQIEVVGIPDSANYFYIADFGRYYFRSDAIKVTKDITQFSLEVDTMATYKGNIGACNAFVEFTSSSDDVTITDPRNNHKGVFDTSYDIMGFTSSPFNAAGCYIIAVLGAGAGNAGIGTYYALTPNEFLQFKSEVYASTFIDLIKDQFTQVRDSFVSCIWLPISISSITGVGGSSIKIGRETLPNCTGKLITDRKITTTTGAVSLSFPSGSGAGVNLKYIDLPPYTTGYLYLPFVGFVPMDMEPAAFFKLLQINAYIDVMTGDIVYRLAYGGGAASSYNGNLATKMPISSSSYDAVGVATGVLTTIGGVVGAIATEGAGAAAFAGAIAGGVQSAKKSMELHTMINGSASSAIGAELGLSCAYVIHQFLPTMDDLKSIKPTLGLPYYKTATISSLTGYVKCAGASVAMPGTSIEKDTVNGYVNGGFYYE